MSRGKQQVLVGNLAGRGVQEQASYVFWLAIGKCKGMKRHSEFWKETHLTAVQSSCGM